MSDDECKKVGQEEFLPRYSALRVGRMPLGHSIGKCPLISGKIPNIFAILIVFRIWEICLSEALSADSGQQNNRIDDSQLRVNDGVLETQFLSTTGAGNRAAVINIIDQVVDIAQFDHAVAVEVGIGAGV